MRDALRMLRHRKLHWAFNFLVVTEIAKSVTDLSYRALYSYVLCVAYSLTSEKAGHIENIYLLIFWYLRSVWGLRPGVLDLY